MADSDSATGWTDEPVSTSHDNLGRTAVARSMATQINALHSWEHSVVFGLTGPWGSGKTSMINMVLERLTQDAGSGTTWSVGRFTPWSANDTEALIREFYQTLMQAYPPEDSRRTKLMELALAASPLLQVIPYAGKAVADITLQQISKRLQDPPWQVLFDDAAKAIRAREQPLLIVADDIDRLHADELLVLLKVVRLLGRFPGVFYLLAYDEQTLHDNLRQAGVGRHDDLQPRRFMEKIVQYQLPVPPLTPAMIIDTLFRELELALNAAGRPMSHDLYARLSELSEPLEAVLTTPRAIGRFIAQVRMSFGLLPAEEVNDGDLILLTLVRVTFPDVYRKLPSWRQELTGNVKKRDVLANVGRTRPQIDWGPLFDGLPLQDRVVARELLEDIFPPVRSGSALSEYRLRRASKEIYFPRYFAHGVPVDDLSDLELDRMLDDAADNGAMSNFANFLQTENYARVDLALIKLAAATTKAAPEHQRRVTRSLFEAVLAALPQLATDSMGSPGHRAILWLRDVIVDLASEEGWEAVAAALENGTDLRTIIQVLQKVESRARHYQPSASVEFSALKDHFAELTCRSLLVGLAAGDRDREDVSYHLYLQFNVYVASPKKLKAGLQELFASQGATVESLAARCVTLSIMDDAGRCLDDLDFALLAELIAKDDPYYQLERMEGLDRRDLSWTNRRLFSQGRWNRNNEEDG